MSPPVLGTVAHRRIARSSFPTLERHYLIDSTGRGTVGDLAGYRGAVIVIPVSGAAVASIEHYRHAAGRRLWVLPAGEPGIDGEPPPPIARRECGEESGLCALPAHLQ